MSTEPPIMWTQAEAIELCRKIEAVCPKYGCHVALTGGLLYKDGERKDCDIVFYRIRQLAEIDFEGLQIALEKLGIITVKCYGFVTKMTYLGKPIDAFDPECIDGGEDGQYENSNTQGLQPLNFDMPEL